LQESIVDARNTKKNLSLIVFDVDDFKSYNDNFGHQAGDKALEFISRAAKTVMRRIDYVARYGGEEFAAVLPGTTKAEALRLAERLREVIDKETSNSWQSVGPKKITVSVGVATYPDDAEDKEKLIFCADGALYEAKRKGKNQVCGYNKPVV
jgi:diguanylate cyclase (GGDEF)-like protein